MESTHIHYFFPLFKDIFRYVKFSMCLLPSPIPCFLLSLDAKRLRGVRTFRPEPLRLIRLSWTWILSTQIPKTNTICRQSPSYITKLKFRNVITTLARLTVSINKDFRHRLLALKKRTGQKSYSRTCAIECHRIFDLHTALGPEIERDRQPCSLIRW